MAENEFLSGVRIEQFIKSNNDQLKESLDKVDKNFSKGLKSILSNQTSQITSLKSIDKTTKSLDKNMSKILSNQDKMIKALTKFKSGGESVTISNLKDMQKATAVKKKDTAAEKKDTFRRVDYDEENHGLLGGMNKSLGVMADKKDKAGGGLLKALMMGASGLLTGGGLIGYILTGKKEGLQAMAKGLFKGLEASFGMGKGILKGVPKIFDGLGTMVKSVGRFKKLISRVGLGKGMKLLGGRAMGKGFAKLGGKAALKQIPGIGSILNLVFAVQKFKKGDVVGGLLEFGSFAADLIPGVGPFIGLALDLYSLKRDLTISPEALQDEKDIFMHPVRSVKTLFQGGRNNRQTARREEQQPAFDAAAAKLRTLSAEERSGFTSYREGQGVSSSAMGDEYSAAVDSYFQSLGKGGGGFQFTDGEIISGNGGSNTQVPAGVDDNYTSNNNKFQTSISRAWNGIRGKNNVKLNPTGNVSLAGMNPTMMRSFYRMAAKYNEDTGGYLMVNSAKRSGGNSVHNKGYAIDVNAMDANGKRYGDGYVPEKYLKANGLHRPLLNYARDYGGPHNEGWHIEPFPGEDVYGGARNTLAAGQPYRKGVLLTGGNGYGDTGGGGFDDSVNLPQGQVQRRVDPNTPINVALSPTDMEMLATAFGKQMKKNIKPAETVEVVGNTSSPRSNL